MRLDFKCCMVLWCYTVPCITNCILYFKDFGRLELWWIGLNCETWTRSRGGGNALVKLVNAIILIVFGISSVGGVCNQSVGLVMVRRLYSLYRIGYLI